MVKRKSKHKFVVVVERRYDSNVKHRDVIDWCTEMFGPGGRNKKCTWRFGWAENNNFYFKQERDAVAFALRWA